MEAPFFVKPEALNGGSGSSGRPTVIKCPLTPKVPTRSASGKPPATSTVDYQLMISEPQSKRRCDTYNNEIELEAPGRECVGSCAGNDKVGRTEFERILPLTIRMGEYYDLIGAKSFGELDSKMAMKDEAKKSLSSKETNPRPPIPTIPTLFPGLGRRKLSCHP